MIPSPDPLDSHHHNPTPTCYFSIQAPSSSHFSIETPNITPAATDCSNHTSADPTNPLLAQRPPPLEFMSAPSDPSRLLQLQTQAAHRPSMEPLQQQRTSSTSSNNSSDSNSSSRHGSITITTMSSSALSCCRCRRQSLANMFQFGTNLYYCSHCAKMVGYSAG